MADVRALLRAEKAARASQITSTAGKKRKAVESPQNERKRSRAEVANNAPAGFYDGGNHTIIDEDVDVPVVEPSPEELDDATPAAEPTPSIPQQPQAKVDDIDEEEWARFEREVVNAPPPPSTTAIFSNAVVGAAPISAAELTAQAREAQSRQRTSRESELEAEKEDAQRGLEDELDTMEALEDRVRRLKEKREALKRGSMSVMAIEEEPVAGASNPAETAGESDEDDDDDEDADDWVFGRA